MLPPQSSLVDQEVDVPVGTPGRQGTGSLCSPVTKANCEFILTRALGGEGAAGAVQRGQGRLHGAGLRAGPGSASRLPPSPHPTGCTRARFPQSSRFSAQCTLVHAPVKSTARRPLFWWARGTEWPSEWGPAPPPPAPRLSAAGSGALRCLP